MRASARNQKAAKDFPGCTTLNDLSFQAVTLGRDLEANGGFLLRAMERTGLLSGPSRGYRHRPLGHMVPRAEGKLLKRSRGRC